VECSVAAVYEKMWTASNYPDSCPVASTVTLKFPGKKGAKDIELHWTDGGIRPERPEELLPDEVMGDEDGSGGVIIEGTKGKMMCGTYGANPTLLPTWRMKNLAVKQTIARVPEGHYLQWVNACIAGYGNSRLSSSFDYAGPLTEAILMGNIALRSWTLQNTKGEYYGRKKLNWDAINMSVTNFDEANQFVKREYREGWKLV
jgi:hypothetical protein